MCVLSFNSPAQKESQRVLSDTESLKIKIKKDHAKRKSYNVQWVVKYWKTCITCVSWDNGTRQGECAVSSKGGICDLPKMKQKKEAALTKERPKQKDITFI